MIVESLYELQYFLIVFFVGVFLFADTFQAMSERLILRGDLDYDKQIYNEQNNYERFFKPYLEQWQLSFLVAIGDIDNDFDNYDVFEFIALFACAIFNITLLLNLVIAIISQTHANVIATQTEKMYSERVKQIVIMQTTFLSRLYRQETDARRLLFTARVIDSEEIARKQKSLKAAKNEIIRFSEKRFEELQGSVDAMEGEIKSLKTTVGNMEKGLNYLVEKQRSQEEAEEENK